MNIKWDAAEYATQFSFVPEYGRGVADLVEVKPGARCLDLGCGNGTLTAALEGRGLDAFGLDASPELIALAQQTYPNLSFAVADATNFWLEKPVDIVFSNAVFHWIDARRQSDMLGCVARALKPGGQFVFEFGGHGNNALIHDALAYEFARRGLHYDMPFYFPTIGTYTPLLERAGFRVDVATLFDRPTRLEGEDGLANWIAVFVKRPFEGMDDTLRIAIVADAVNNLREDLYHDGVWFADYVRLRCKATKLS